MALDTYISRPCYSAPGWIQWIIMDFVLLGLLLQGEKKKTFNNNEKGEVTGSVRHVIFMFVK